MYSRHVSIHRLWYTHTGRVQAPGREGGGGLKKSFYCKTPRAVSLPSNFPSSRLLTDLDFYPFLPVFMTWPYFKVTGRGKGARKCNIASRFPLVSSNIYIYRQRQTERFMGVSARVSALSDKWPLSLKHNVDCYGRENDLPKCPADRRSAGHHFAGQEREVPS